MVISVYSGAFLQKPVAYLAQFLLFCANDLTRTLFVVKAATMSHRILHMQIKLTGILCVEPKWFLSSPYFRFNPPLNQMVIFYISIWYKINKKLCFM